MSIHARIKQLREARGMSMLTLADLVGVSAWQTVQQWEKEDGTAPKRERLAAVAAALQTTPEYLLFGDGGSSASTREKKRVDYTDVFAASEAGISMTALRVAQSFDKLDSTEKKQAILAQLKAFGFPIDDSEDDQNFSYKK
ncbi:helix-turn-helix domain-containing protein [Herbaspirillum rubrisubalbicans]|uniref:Helix-turn-helix domain-containing protein n=1 Tax=Herbaspirillum rubrisubalbicans TaxID=80842 RepID=A0AAD0UH21_9BURK|nr:helix-turn-helix domain-containing protein [Herbaspirillum rubrisubalbicans]AYR26904.1 helix-turn-helix domain-containing protein [Herbaspirillum rubrisubalbicans]